MLALARFTLKGPYQAALVVGLLAVLAVFIPPFVGFTYESLAFAIAVTLVATIMVGLIILTQGSTSGLKAIGVSVLGVTLVAWVVLNSPEQGIMIALGYWLPVVILAQTLRSTNSLALTLLTGVGVGIIGIAAQYLFWTDLESSFISQIVLSRGGEENLTQEEVEHILLSVRLMGWLTVSSLYLLFVLIVFVARWLQARLVKSDGFGKEFRSLVLGKPAAVITMVIVPLGFLVDQQWIISLAFLMAMAFMFQGIAVVHARLATRKQPLFFFVLFYLLLIFMAQITATLTSITGMIDNWLVFRRKPEESNHAN
jgi:hypothetical protein